MTTKGLTPDKAAKLRLHRAYRALLSVPHDTQSRVTIQPALALVRDELARLSDADPQVLQDAYEMHTHGAGP